MFICFARKAPLDDLRALRRREPMQSLGFTDEDSSWQALAISDLISWSISLLYTYILTDSTHLFRNKRLIHVSVLIFPLTSLCVPVSFCKPAKTRLFKPLFYACFLQVHQSTRLWVGYWESSTLGWSVMIRRSNCPCDIRAFRNSL